MSVTVDPVLPAVMSLALGAVFLAGAADKLREREIFVGIVQAYGLLPIPLVVVFSLLVAVAELMIGVGLCVSMLREFAAPAGLGLLAVVTAAVMFNLLRGKTELACGCGGASADQTLSWTLVIRNLLLAVMLSTVLWPTASRAFGVIDYVTILLGAAMLFGLYAAANQLLANAPRVASLMF